MIKVPNELIHVNFQIRPPNLSSSPWHMGTHLRELSESYLMNTNMTGFRWFSKILASLCLDESSLSIGIVKDEVLKH